MSDTVVGTGGKSVRDTVRDTDFSLCVGGNHMVIVEET